MYILGRILRWVLILLVIALAVWGIWYLISRAISHPAVSNVAVNQNTPLVNTPAPAKEQVFTELRSDEYAATGLGDQSVNPKVVLGPGEGLMLSSDPGGMMIEGTSIDSESLGYMAYVWNHSDKAINVILHTGWNGPNARWNIHPVVYKVLDVNALREHVLMINEGEKKPVVFGYIFTTDNFLIVDPDLK